MLPIIAIIRIAMAMYSRQMAADNSQEISRLKRNLIRALREDVTDKSCSFLLDISTDRPPFFHLMDRKISPAAQAENFLGKFKIFFFFYLTSLSYADQRCLLQDRIRMLSTMLREARELAVLTERYYDRGYRRNAKYTI